MELKGVYLWIFYNNVFDIEEKGLYFYGDVGSNWIENNLIINVEDIRENIAETGKINFFDNRKLEELKEKYSLLDEYNLEWFFFLKFQDTSNRNIYKC